VPGPTPLRLFREYLTEARAAQGQWSDAFVLATASNSARPSARALVLRGLDELGVVFFTDEGSRKGQELASNPWATAVFVWPVLRREVRLEGEVTKLTADESDALFSERPDQHRLALWAWRQDEVVADAAELEARLERTRLSWQHGPIPRPSYWAGYRLEAEMIEFWQERDLGLHERIRHRRAGRSWEVQRLAP
jgi:pyridoxamine 5'-phosphate oxidase